MTHFSPRLRALAHIRRWAVMPTQRPDFVSSHSFFTAVYALQIAKLIRWPGDIGKLLTCALLHDVEEAVTGDVCYGIKEGITDKEKATDYISGRMMEAMPELVRLQGEALFDVDLDKTPTGGVPDEKNADEIMAIVRAADRLDAVLYCAMECAMGNTVMTTRFYKSVELLKKAWWKLPGMDEAERERTWHQVIIASALAHKNAGSYDVDR